MNCGWAATALLGVATFVWADRIVENALYTSHSRFHDTLYLNEEILRPLFDAAGRAVPTNSAYKGYQNDDEAQDRMLKQLSNFLESVQETMASAEQDLHHFRIVGSYADHGGRGLVEAQGGALGGIMKRLGATSGASALTGLVQSFMSREMDAANKRNGFRVDPRCDANQKGTCCFFLDLCDPVAECVAETNPQSLGDLARLVPQCVCPSGFEGDGKRRSEGCTNIDECKAGIALCEHKCVDMAPGYRCECKEGYRLLGDARNCADVDECLENAHDCDQTCINRKGGFQCACRHGFKPDPINPHKCVDVDECAEEGVCQFMDLCINEFGSYHCQCPEGTVTSPADPSRCVDVNECITLDSPCPNGRLGMNTAELRMTQFCENVAGGYNCHCLPGLRETGSTIDPLMPIDERFRGVGFRELSMRLTQAEIRARDLLCIDIDECADTDLCPAHNAVCVNEFRGYSCRCLDPQMQWDENSKSCRKDAQCRRGTCGEDPNAVCIQGSEGFECVCRDGYQLIEDGVDLYCRDVDECSLDHNPCPEGALCLNYIGGYTCECEPGFELNDGRCQDIDECSLGLCPSPCINVGGSYSCQCPSGSAGRGRNDPGVYREWALNTSRINSISDVDQRIEVYLDEIANNQLICDQYEMCAESMGTLCGAGAQCRSTSSEITCHCPLETEPETVIIGDSPLLEDVLTRQITLHVRTLPLHILTETDPRTLLIALASLEPPIPAWKVVDIPWANSGRFHVPVNKKHLAALIGTPSKETILALLLGMLSNTKISSCEEISKPSPTPSIRPWQRDGASRSDSKLSLRSSPPKRARAWSSGLAGLLGGNLRQETPRRSLNGERRSTSMNSLLINNAVFDQSQRDSPEFRATDPTEVPHHFTDLRDELDPDRIFVRDPEVGAELRSILETRLAGRARPIQKFQVEHAPQGLVDDNERNALLKQLIGPAAVWQLRSLLRDFETDFIGHDGDPVHLLTSLLQKVFSNDLEDANKLRNGVSWVSIRNSISAYVRSEDFVKEAAEIHETVLFLPEVLTAIESMSTLEHFLPPGPLAILREAELKILGKDAVAILTREQRQLVLILLADALTESVRSAAPNLTHWWISSTDASLPRKDSEGATMPMGPPPLRKLEGAPANETNADGDPNVKVGGHKPSQMNAYASPVGVMSQVLRMLGFNASPETKVELVSDILKSVVRFTRKVDSPFLRDESPFLSGQSFLYALGRGNLSRTAAQSESSTETEVSTVSNLSYDETYFNPLILPSCKVIYYTAPTAATLVDLCNATTMRGVADAIPVDSRFYTFRDLRWIASLPGDTETERDLNSYKLTRHNDASAVLSVAPVGSPPLRKLAQDLTESRNNLEILEALMTLSSQDSDSLSFWTAPASGSRRRQRKSTDNLSGTERIELPPVVTISNPLNGETISAPLNFSADGGIFVELNRGKRLISGAAAPREKEVRAPRHEPTSLLARIRERRASEEEEKVKEQNHGSKQKGQRNGPIKESREVANMYEKNLEARGPAITGRRSKAVGSFSDKEESEIMPLADSIQD